MTDDERYAAIQARDARFDGVFFTCVRTTGIFCRPSCPARTPGRGSVEFVASAAAAIEAGFRACKRCGPAAPPAPPGSPDGDPTTSLATRALRLIDAGALDGRGSVPELADRLAVSERTLHRAMVAATGAAPLTHARLRRARRAHDLVAGSDLPLADIAHAAGFGSERQLHEVFTRIYGHPPSAVRGRRGSRSAPAEAPQPLWARLAVRRPFDGAGLLDWFATRAIPGVEAVTGTTWTRAVHLPHGPGVLAADLDIATGPIQLGVRLADLRDYGAAVALARQMLDLDADPVGIDAGLAAAGPVFADLVARRPGVRIPGTPSPAEALLWAITGQQISVGRTTALITAATDLRCEALPDELRTEQVWRPPVRPEDAARTAETWFAGPAARRRALEAAIPAMPDPGTDPAEARAALLRLGGVGPWTADYALLRGMRAIDVAPMPDAALLNAARDLGIADTPRRLTAALARAAPWRSYAAMLLWHHGATLPAGPSRPVRKEQR